MASQELSFAIKAVNEASKALKDVEGDIGKVGAAAADAEKKSGGFGKALVGIGTVAGGILAAGALSKLGGFMTSAAQAALEEEAATRRLHQTFKNYADMVGATPGTFEALNGLLNERIDIGQKLAFTDDEIRNSFNALLTATDDSTEATKRQSAAMDLSRGAGISLEAATKLLGKMTGENVEVFKKMGITIGENATEADALAEVQARFGGQAEAYAQSTAGQFEQTKIRMGELKEQIGMQLLPIMTKIGTVLVEEVVPRLEKFANYFQENIAPKIKSFWENDAKPVLKAIGEFIETVVMPKVKENFAKFQVYYETDIKPALDNIMAAIEKVVTFLKEHWGQIEPFVRPIFIAIETAAKVALGLIKVAIDLLGGDWKGAVEGMRDIWNTITDGFKDAFYAAKDQILVAVGLLTAGFAGIAGAIQGAFESAIGMIIGLINQAISAYNKLPGVPNISQIGSGSAPTSTSQYGAPTGDPNAQLPGREIFGQGVGGGGSYVDPRGATMTADDILAQRQANGGGFTVQINAPVYGVDDLIYTIDRALKRGGQAGLVPG